MRLKSKTLSIIFKSVIAICGIVGVELSLKLFTSGVNYGMLNYFTNLSNIFVFIYYICAVIWLIKNRNDDTKVTFCPVFRGMALMVITLTFLVVVFILRMGFTMNNTMGISLLLLHYIVPSLTIFDWLIFDEKGLMKKTYPLIWTIPPIVYIAYAMIAARIGDGIGAMGSRYPYPFLDVDALGVRNVALIIIALSILYIGMGYIYFAIDHSFAKKAKKASAKK